MEVSRFLGWLVATITEIILAIVKGLAQELLHLARGLLVFVPMLALGLMVFMFFQANLSMAQADVMGLLIVTFVCGWATGMILRGKVDAFWKKD